MAKVPSFLFSADPASHRTGLAGFSKGVLVAAALVRSDAPAYETRAMHMYSGAVVFRRGIGFTEETFATPAGVAHQRAMFGARDDRAFVMEWPEIYRESKAKPDDVLKIAGIATAVAMAFVGHVPDANFRRVLPKTWKGQTKKFNRDDNGEKIYLMWNLIGPALSAAEKKVLDDLPKGEGKVDDVLDAVGVGLHYLARI
jgi:hypothetical protein